MDRLVCIKNDQVMTTSKAVADSFGREHKDVLKSVRDLIKSGHLGGREFTLTSYTDKSNRQSKMFLLTERGFLIAMPFIGGSKSKDGQVKLVDEFIKMREALRIRQTTEWQQSRSKGKLQRRDETDAISEYLLPLVRMQAPESSYCEKPENAYITYSRLVKAALKAKWDSRNDLTWQYLNAVESIERNTCVTIKQECEKGTHYKAIYKKCRANADDLVGLLCLDGKPLLIEKKDKLKDK